MKRVDMIAEAVRSYGVKGKGVDVSELAEWIDLAITPAIHDELGEAQASEYKIGWQAGHIKGYNEGWDMAKEDSANEA